uniref:Uncharacterized protein n=1 Tax=Glycine max TaxID=3847 RepID=C6TBA2_SOYBN|nr:unknown [Glycine max]
MVVKMQIPLKATLNIKEACPMKSAIEKTQFRTQYSGGRILAGVGSCLSFPKKSADSQTGPRTSNFAISASVGAGETSSICCYIIESIMLR